MLDPLVFLLPYPDISKRLEEEPKNFYEFFVRRFMMREPAIAFALNRKSKWPECCFWAEDLRKFQEDSGGNFAMSVALSQRDCFFDVKMVEEYLNRETGPWLKRETFNCTHGELIFRPDLVGQIVKLMSSTIH